MKAKQRIDSYRLPLGIGRDYWWHSGVWSWRSGEIFSPGGWMKSVAASHKPCSTSAPGQSICCSPVRGCALLWGWSLLVLLSVHFSPHLSPSKSQCFALEMYLSEAGPKWVRAAFSVALVELVSLVFLFLDSVLDCLLKGHCNLLALKITFRITAADEAGERSPLVYWDLPWVWQHSKGGWLRESWVIDRMHEHIFPVGNIDSIFILKNKGK